MVIKSIVALSVNSVSREEDKETRKKDWEWKRMNTKRRVALIRTEREKASSSSPVKLNEGSLHVHLTHVCVRERVYEESIDRMKGDCRHKSWGSECVSSDHQRHTAAPVSVQRRERERSIDHRLGGQWQAEIPCEREKLKWNLPANERERERGSARVYRTLWWNMKEREKCLTWTTYLFIYRTFIGHFSSLSLSLESTWKWVCNTCDRSLGCSITR